MAYDLTNRNVKMIVKLNIPLKNDVSGDVVKRRNKSI